MLKRMFPVGGAPPNPPSAIIEDPLSRSIWEKYAGPVRRLVLIFIRTYMSAVPSIACVLCRYGASERLLHGVFQIREAAYRKRTFCHET
jgi:hypothetical protein